jgi:hypothetical protein
MTGNEQRRAPEERPRVSGSYDEPDPSATAASAAIGQAVLAVAALEKCLELELLRLVAAQAGAEENLGPLLEARLASMSRMTAGQLLREVRRLGLPSDLDDRISAVITRRNDLVHHMYEDPAFVQAFLGGEHLRLAMGRLQQLAVDAAELAVELQLFAVPKLEAVFGLTQQDLVQLVKGMDAQAVTDARYRKQVDAIQAFLEVCDLDLGIGDPAVDPPGISQDEP